MTSDLQGLNVWVVDDDDLFRRVLVTQLGQLCVENVTSIGSGREAIDLLGTGEPLDVVVCDLRMPDIDGIRLLRHIAEMRPGVSVIIASGVDERLRQSVSRLAKAHPLNILGTVGKPVSRDTLRDLLAGANPYRAPPSNPVETPGIDAEDVRRGLEAGEMAVYGQPIVRASDRRPVGVEALVRWQHPEFGLVGPDRFIEIAEEASLIDQLMDVVLRQASTGCQRWVAQGIDVWIAVNASAYNLLDLQLPERLLTIVEAAGLAPERMQVELTESELMRDIARSLDVLTRLNINGVQLAIDDFGTGFSSMQQLQQAPFSELKIDRSFVAASIADDNARAIVESTVALAHRLGMRTVAEGVESEEQWTLVKDLGCDLVQGFLIAKPMPLDDFASWYWSRSG